jgi:hypothetical protein
MDPKSLDGKPPELPVTKPDFGAKVAAWVHKDMVRAHEARKRKEKDKKK